MAYGTCMNNEDHYGVLCSMCDCCGRCCDCSEDSTAGAYSAMPVMHPGCVPRPPCRRSPGRRCGMTFYPNSIPDQRCESINLQRIGEFYEAVNRSALRLVDACGVTITHKECGELAGIPAHLFKSYLPRMLSAGYVVRVTDPIPPGSPNDARIGSREREYRRVHGLPMFKRWTTKSYKLENDGAA